MFVKIHLIDFFPVNEVLKVVNIDLVERDGDIVLIEWEGFVDPGSYTWESVSNLQNDLGIDVFTNFLDALPQVEVEGARDLQGVQAEVSADVAEGNGAPRRSNRLRVTILAWGESLEFPPTNSPVQPLLSRAYTT